MTINSTVQHNRRSVSISGPLTIYEAAESKSALLGELDADHVLDVDLSEVSELDTAGLQLLLMLKLEAQRTEKRLHFVGHSRAVLRVIDLYNLAGVFGDPVVFSGEEKR